MIVGCYSIDIYCDIDNWQHMGVPTFYKARFMQQFTGETRGECLREARALGWQIGRQRQLCPVCMNRQSTTWANEHNLFYHT